MSNKIVIFSPDYKPMLGGVAEYTYQLAKELNKLDLLNTVITSVLQIETPVFTLKGLNKYKNDRFLGKRIGDSFYLFKKINSAIYYINIAFFVIFEILKISLKNPKDLFIITYISNTYSILVIQILHFLKLKYAIVLHGYDILNLIKSNKNFLDFVCKSSNLIIFNSHATKKLLKDNSIQYSCKDYILYPGLDIEFLEGKKKKKSKDLEIDLTNKFLITTISRLTKRKGIDIAIQALKRTLRENDDYIYLIAGTGQEYDYLKKIVNELELNEKVRFLGKISDEAKFNLLELSSVFIMPNHSNLNKDFEGFGISFIEASFFENVIIAGNHGGAVESVENSKCGILVDADNRDNAIKEISDYLDLVISNEDLRKEISISARKHVVSNYDIKLLVNSFSEFLIENALI